MMSLVTSVSNTELYIRVAELCVRHDLPRIREERLFAERHGLIAYGADVAALFRRAAYCVGWILAGAWPAELPVEQPTNFDLVENPVMGQVLTIAIPNDVTLQITDWIG